MATGDIVVSRANEGGTAVEFVCGPCQEEVCCMYPWATDYIEEDLPARLLLSLYGFIDPSDRTDEPLIYDVGTGEYYNSEGANDFRITPFNVDGATNGWYLEWLLHGVWTTFDWTGLCTILENATIIIIRDEFPLTLTVNGTDTITRQGTHINRPDENVCLWVGDGWTLSYKGSTKKFYLNGEVKDSAQGTPIGSYGLNEITI